VSRQQHSWARPGQPVNSTNTVLAASEAVSNAAEHGTSPPPSGMIELSGGLESTAGGQRRVTLIVRDHRR